MKSVEHPIWSLMPIVAGLAGVVRGQWISVAARRREALDEWWYRIAVEESIEPITDFLDLIQHRAARRIGYKVVDEKPYPRAALHSLNTIAPTGLLSDFLFRVIEFDEATFYLDVNSIFGATIRIKKALNELAEIFADIQLNKKSDTFRVKYRADVKEKIALIDEATQYKWVGVPVLPDNVSSENWHVVSSDSEDKPARPIAQDK